MQTVRKIVAKCRLPEENPTFSAAVAAFVYVVLAGVYILVSGRIAALFAGSLEQLQAIEAVKGIVFVVVTGVLFFFISFGWWRTTRRQRDLLIQSERRAVASMYNASLAHDLNNMLLGLLGLVQELKEHEKDERISSLRDSVEQAILTLVPLSKRIASAARQFRPDDFTAVDISQELTHTAELARKHPDVRFCNIQVASSPAIVLPLNKELLDQAILNLILNAAQAAGPRGRIEMGAKRVADSIAVEIHDNGPGIPHDKVDSIFDAGFTTKTDGSGLGLLSVRAFSASCHARISVARSPLGGALFRLVIPVDQKASDTSSKSAANPAFNPASEAVQKLIP